MAATAADIQKLNTTVISLMKHLYGIDQQMVEQGKIDSLSGDLGTPCSRSMTTICLSSS